MEYCAGPVELAGKPSSFRLLGKKYPYTPRVGVGCWGKQLRLGAAGHLHCPSLVSGKADPVAEAELEGDLATAVQAS